MLAAGERIKDIALLAGVAEKTVFAWIKEPETLACYRTKLEGYAVEHYSKAVQVLSRQLDSNNEWVAQGAARELMSRMHDAVTGVDSREIVIRLEGAPAIGIPAPAADHDDTGLPTDNATDYIIDNNPDVV